MIIIKTENKNRASLNVKKGTPHTTMLLGIEMLIEALINESNGNLDIDYVLEKLKRIYIRDNGVKNESN